MLNWWNSLLAAWFWIRRATSVGKIMMLQKVQKIAGENCSKEKKIMLRKYRKFRRSGVKWT
jgi:hypothetical protein